MPEVALAHIRTRTVWYVHGFDPATTARYRRIFTAAAERFDVEITDLDDDTEGWVATRDGVRTEFRYVRYQDLVWGFGDRTHAQRLTRGLGAFWSYVRSGSLRRIAKRTPRGAALIASPWLFLFGLPLSVLVPAASIGPWALGLIAGAAVVCNGLFSRFYLDLLADLFAYQRVLAAGVSEDWTAYRRRMEKLAGDIEPGTADEVLIVGHSLGGIGAILIADQVAARQPGAALSLMTLGSTHGIVLSQTGAGRDHLAAAIHRVATAPGVNWLDVSSPRDAFCVPLTDPLLLAGPPPDAARSPRVISAPLRNAPPIPGDRRTVFAAMRRHMGYLMAPQQSGAFDYADWITGTEPLGARIARRGNSPKARMWHG
ncbi:MAG: hypothetical protein AAFV19_09680 [Pseudomonadota bacterium]